MPQLTPEEVQQLQQRVAELELTLDNLTKSQSDSPAPGTVIASEATAPTSGLSENIRSAIQSCINELQQAVLSGPNPTSLKRVEKVIISLSGTLL